MSEKREAGAVRLRQTTFGELTEGARFLYLELPSTKITPHHAEHVGSSRRVEDDVPVVEIVDEPEPSLSLAEFAQTEQARQNAASWENLPGHGNRDGSAKVAAATGDGPEASSSLVVELRAAATIARRRTHHCAENEARAWDGAAELAALYEAHWQAERDRLREQWVLSDVTLDAVTQERDTLVAFKSYVHERLDAAGIPAHPDGPHSREGCRIGDRFDLVLAELAEARQSHAGLREGLTALANDLEQSDYEQWSESTGQAYSQCANRICTLLASTSAAVEGTAVDLLDQIKALAERLDTIAGSYDDYPLQQEAYKRAAVTGATGGGRTP